LLTPILDVRRPVLDDIADAVETAWTRTGNKHFDLLVSPDSYQNIIAAMNAHGSKEHLVGVVSLSFTYGTVRVVVDDELPEGSYTIQ
jgi:hypothetical protein